MPRLFAALHRFVWDRPGATVLLLAVLSAAAALAASRLRFSSDLAKILPRHSPAVVALNEAMDHFAFTGQMYVFFEKKDPAAGEAAARRLADALARRLQGAPEVARVDWKVGAESEGFMLEMVSKHGPLMLDDGEMGEFLKRLEAGEIRRVVRRNRLRLASPGVGAADVLVEQDPLDLTRDFFLKKAAAARPVGRMDLSDGYYFNERRDALVMTVEGRQPTQDVAFAKKLVGRARGALAEARAEVPEAAGWEVTLLGGYPVALQNEATIRGDLVINLLTSVPPVLLMLVLSLRRWFGLAIGAVALGLGLLWTFGLAGLAYGHLTAVTVAFAGLLAGVGIDLTIHMFHRYRHERAEGRLPAEASLETFRGGGPGAFTAAITTVFSILCLWISDFQGLREFATLVGVGLMLVFAATFFVIPLFTRREPADHREVEISPWTARACWALFAVYLVTSVRLFTGIGLAIAAACLLLMTRAGMRAVIALVTGRPRLALAVAGLATAAALAAMSRPPLGFPERETDVTNLRTEGDTLIAAQERLRAAFDAGIDPILVLDRARGEDDALARAAALSAALDRVPGVAHQSIARFVPPPAEQARRARRLADVDPARVAADLDAALDAEGFDPAAFADARARLRALLSAREPVRPSTLHAPFFDALRNRFLAWDPGGDVYVLTWVLPRSALHRRQDREQTLAALESAIHGASPTATLTGFNVIVRELDEQIGPDVLWSSVAGIAVSCLLAWVLYRSFFWMAVSILPALVGTLWLLGLLKLMGTRMNWLSLIVFPIMAGIATDNGLYMVERFREIACRSAGDMLRSLWHGLTLVSLTSVVGFGSLAFSTNRAMRSLGVALAVAMLCYTFSSLLVLPPILKWLETGKGREPGGGG